jgi:hypothetical protein
MFIPILQIDDEKENRQNNNPTFGNYTAKQIYQEEIAQKRNLQNQQRPRFDVTQPANPRKQKQQPRLNCNQKDIYPHQIIIGTEKNVLCNAFVGRRKEMRDANNHSAKHLKGRSGVIEVSYSFKFQQSDIQTVDEIRIFGVYGTRIKSVVKQKGKDSPPRHKQRNKTKYKVDIFVFHFLKDIKKTI